MLGGQSAVGILNRFADRIAPRAIVIRPAFCPFDAAEIIAETQRRLEFRATLQAMGHHCPNYEVRH